MCDDVYVCKCVVYMYMCERTYFKFQDFEKIVSFCAQTIQLKQDELVPLNSQIAWVLEGYFLFNIFIFCSFVDFFLMFFLIKRGCHYSYW